MKYKHFKHVLNSKALGGRGLTKAISKKNICCKIILRGWDRNYLSK